jgi:dual specificity phosphatase 12
MEYLMENYNKVYNTTNSIFNVTPIFFWRIVNRHYEGGRESVYKNNKYDSLYAFFSPCNHIIDNIFLGSTYNAADWEMLRKLAIKKIINITEDVPNFYEDKDIEYFNINITDDGSEDLNVSKLNKMVEFVNSNNNDNILIHCLVGRSRSVSALCYILNKNYGKNIEESLLLVKNKREFANPSKRFYDNLISFCKK